MKRGKVPVEPSAAERTPDEQASPVDRAKVKSWSPEIRAHMHALLLRGVTVKTRPAVVRAIREITDLIEEVSAAEAAR